MGLKRRFLDSGFHQWLLAWKPIPLCWFFRRMGWPIPRYLIGHDIFTPAQDNFRFYEEGSEDGSSPIDAENTSISRAVNADSDLHLRLLIQATNTAPGASTDDYQLQYSKNSGTFTNITASSADVQGYASAGLTDGSATTNRATNGISDGTGSFVAGEQAESGLVTDHLLTGSNFTEHVFALRLLFADLANADTIDFRLLVNGGTMVYNVTPQITVSQTNPSLDDASMADADRNWDTPSQDIALTFSEAVDITPTPGVGDTIAGLTAKVNGGAAQALTYVSGNASASWKVRRAELIQQDDSVTVTYAMATGDILAVDDNAEVKNATDLAVTNNLTKRVRETIKDKNNAIVASESMSYGIHEFDSGNPANANWMSRSTKGSSSTDASGVFDVQYTGASAVGATVYLVVERTAPTPDETALARVAVQ